MKVLFLDIDGVLNFEGTEACTPTGKVGIVDVLVKKLKSILDQTGAIVVLSSDWKKLWDPYAPVEDLPPDGQYLVRKLRRSGIHLSSRISPNFDRDARGAAILDWLEKNTQGQPCTWCALDDWLFKDYIDLDLLDHVVITNTFLGLANRDVEKAVAILNKPPEEANDLE